MDPSSKELGEQALFQIDALADNYQRQSRQGLNPSQEEFLRQVPPGKIRDLLREELDDWDRFLLANDTNSQRRNFQHFRLEVPETIADYRILRPLGRGSFGVVLLGEQLVTGKLVALKLPHPCWLVYYSKIGLFNEIKTLSKLNHPNIARFVEAKQSDGNWIICTEYIPGANLEEKLQWRRLTLKQSLKIICELLDAIQYAHRLGIVHQDINPRNIMIGEDEVTRLLDFGLARFYADSQVSRMAHVKPRGSYAAPEHEFSDRSVTDPRSDLYGVAVVLFELLTGCLAARNSDFVSIQHRLQRNLDEPTATNLAAICGKGLAHDPDHRFQSADEFRQAITQFQKEESLAWLREDVVSRRNGSQSTPASLFAKPMETDDPRYLSGIFWLAIAICLVTFVSGFVFRQSGPDDPANRNARITIDQAEAELSHQLIHQGEVAVQFVTSPPKARIVVYPLARGSKIELRHGRQVGVSPVLASLSPGEYFIVAELKTDLFAEVYRTVPADMRDSKSPFPHLSCRIDESVVVLPTINIEPFSSEGMAQVGNFWIDQKSVKPADVFGKLREHDIVCGEITNDAAFAYAELIGRRLADRDEIELADTADVILIDQASSEITTTPITIPDMSRVGRRLATTRYSSSGSVRHQLQLPITSFRTARSKRPLTKMEVGNE